MSDRFGLTALRLAGMAARMLGWRPAEFWAATPAELFTALAPDRPTGLDRDALTQMMERIDGRSG